MVLKFYFSSYIKISSLLIVEVAVHNHHSLMAAIQAFHSLAFAVLAFHMVGHNLVGATVHNLEVAVHSLVEAVDLATYRNPMEPDHILMAYHMAEAEHHIHLELGQLAFLRIDLGHLVQAFHIQHVVVVAIAVHFEHLAEFQQLPRPS